MEISQIFLSDAGNELPPALLHAASTIDAAFPAVNHTIYNKETLRQFIAENYDEEVLWAYDCLLPYSYKSDLGRYCLLNKLGGWYVDIAVRIANPVEVGGRVKMLVFRDIQRFSGTGWSCLSGLLYSQPGAPALTKAIELIVENCKQKHYGITPLCPTGPTVFGRALAMQGADPDIVYGDFIELTPNQEQKNRAFVLPDGTIMAWGKTVGGGDLAGLGAIGVNNYNSLWRQRQAYAN